MSRRVAVVEAKRLPPSGVVFAVGPANVAPRSAFPVLQFAGGQIVRPATLPSGRA